MEEEARFDGSKSLITISAMLAGLLAFVDISIVTVALSDIRVSFGAPINQISWVSTSYMMGNVLVMPLSGWLQKRFGYRRYFAASILLFTFASALCGCAWSLPSLVVCRALQGLGGGAIIPTAQAILFIRYPKREHGRAAALFGLAAVTGPLLGPYLGGKLIDVANWHWIFLVNLPLGVLAAWLAATNLRESNTQTTSPGVVDWPGIALLAMGLPTLQYVLEEGNRDGWLESRTIATLLVISGISLVTFVVHEVETDAPVIDLKLFRSASYSAATAINFLLGVSVFAGGFMLSLFCGSLMKYSALEIGLVFLRGNWLLIVLMPIMGRIVGRVSGRALISGGIVLMAVSLWMNGHLTPQVDTRTLVAPLLVRSVGMALTFIPLFPYALSDVPAQQRGNAAAMFNVTRELGGSIGTAWMTTSLDEHVHEYAWSLGRALDPYNAVAVAEIARMRMYLHQGDCTWDADVAAMAVAKLRVAGQALSLAFNHGFQTLALVFVLALLLTPWLRSPKTPVDDHMAH
jgi:MFS transporter, DHA2 family, multidrug resistance protein